MRALILAAGYAKRLEQDLQGRAEYAALQGIPKALLPIADQPLLNYLRQSLQEVQIIPYIWTNGLQYAQFRAWAEQHHFPQEYVLTNGSTTPQGALRDLSAALGKIGYDDDLLVLAGDTLFPKDFRFAEAIGYFQKQHHSVIGRYVETKDLSKRGVMEIDADDRVRDFVEKPTLGTVDSHWASVVLYLLRKEDLPAVDQYLTTHTKAYEGDALGLFLSWFHQQVPVYSFPLSGRWDVGNLEEYVKTCQEYGR